MAIPQGFQKRRIIELARQANPHTRISSLAWATPAASRTPAAVASP
jgi:hypothetical protein